jgi:hypothetical protein
VISLAVITKHQFATVFQVKSEESLQHRQGKKPIKAGVLLLFPYVKIIHEIF